MMSEELDLYHTCRWCKWYMGGKCVNEAFSQEKDTFPVYSIAESGRLSEVILETLTSISLEDLTVKFAMAYDELTKSEFKAKRVGIFGRVLRETLGEFFEKECVDRLDEAVSKLYQEDADRTAKSSSSGGVQISDPERFYCKEFW